MDESDSAPNEANFSVRIHEAEAMTTTLPIAGLHISRRPAALVGIALVTTIGFLFFQGLDILTAQMPTSQTEINISDSGISPLQFSAAPGETITWVNNQNIPHILQSDTLCADGECMFTSSIFPGETGTYVVPTTVAPGTYTYFSATSSNIEGEIIVSGSAVAPAPTPAPAPVPAPIAESAPSFGTDPIVEESPEPTGPRAVEVAQLTAPLGTESVSPSAPTAPVKPSADIPRNPFTIDSGRTGPSVLAADASETLHSGAPLIGKGKGPLNQPETGAGILIVCCASFVLFWMMARRMLAHI